MILLYASGIIVGAIIGMMMPVPPPPWSPTEEERLGVNGCKQKYSQKDGKVREADAATESTRVPEDDDACSDVSESNADTAKESSCRSNKSKGKGKLKKQLERAKARAIALGVPWEDKEVVEKRKAEEMGVTVQSYKDAFTQGVKAGAVQEASRAEKMHWLHQSWHEAFEMPVLDGSMTREQAPDMWLRSGRCTLCSKLHDSWHEQGESHREKARMANALDVLLGPVQYRVLQQGYRPEARENKSNACCNLICVMIQLCMFFEFPAGGAHGHPQQPEAVLGCRDGGPVHAWLGAAAQQGVRHGARCGAEEERKHHAPHEAHPRLRVGHCALHAGLRHLPRPRLEAHALELHRHWGLCSRFGELRRVPDAAEQWAGRVVACACA